MMDDKYWPRTIDELAEDPIPLTVLNEPAAPANVSAPRPKERSLHAVLCEALTNTQALLTRLEGGVRISRLD
jgi:hypothetical protein